MVIGKCELDSYTDTTSLGRNFVSLYYIDKQGAVRPFNNSLVPVDDIQIGTGATAWTNKTYGKTYILKIHHILMFCDSVPHILINPYQIRHCSHKLPDPTRDTDKPPWITDYDSGTFIPFLTNEVIIGFEIQTPTVEW